MADTTSLERYETPVIASFRDYYRNTHTAQELEFVSLVSSHDPTIRFTNSTTSVMKPFLEEPLESNTILYMAQPAMGTQGLSYWKNNRMFGPYASYFISLGSLYPVGGEDDVIHDAFGLPRNWGYDGDAISLEVYEGDQDLMELAHSGHGNVVKKSEIDLFRHKYGIEGLIGRNINLVASDATGFRHILGNITEISRNNSQTAWEISFDSTTATAVVRGLRHAVEAHASVALNYTTALEIAAADFVTVIAPLFLEGLEPRSRGRGGILRQFLAEYTSLSIGSEASKKVVADRVLEVCEAELVMRNALSRPAATNAFSYENALRIADKWLS